MMNGNAKEIEVVHDTEFYTVELHREDPDDLWFHIVSKEYGLVECKESLKPQALVFCEQFSLLIKQETHKTIAKNMVDGMAEEALMAYEFNDKVLN